MRKTLFTLAVGMVGCGSPDEPAIGEPDGSADVGDSWSFVPPDGGEEDTFVEDTSLDDTMTAVDASLDARDATTDARDAAPDARDAAPFDGATYAVTPRTGVCTLGGWCWTTQRPVGNLPYHVWASATDDVWVTAETHTLLHWNGATWSALQFDVPVSDVTGTSKTDVWVSSGIGTVFHFDGIGWTAHPLPAPLGIITVASRTKDDVWAAGPKGTVFRWNGTTWSAIASEMTADVFAIAAVAANDVWFVGSLAARYHYDGANFTGTSNPDSSLQFTSVWAAAPNDVWAAGNFGAVMRWNGTEWKNASPPGSDSGSFWNVHGTASDDVWAVGYGRMMRWNGVEWATARTTGEFHLGVAALSKTDVWTTNPVEHFDGASWKRSFEGPRMTAMSAMHGRAADDIWAVGAGAMHWNGIEWSASTLPTDEQYEGVYVAAANDVVAVGRDTGKIARWNGSTWSIIASGVVQLFGVWGSAANDVWAVGNGKITRWNGATWTVSDAGSVLYDVSGSAADDVWAVGMSTGVGGTARHWNGANWTAFALPSIAEGVWVRSKTDAWAVGFGKVNHWDGVAWTTTTVAKKELHGVFGFAADDVWAGGREGVLLHWNGIEWSPEAMGTVQSFQAFWGAHAGDVHTITRSGAMRRKL